MKNYFEIEIVKHIEKTLKVSTYVDMDGRVRIAENPELGFELIQNFPDQGGIMVSGVLKNPNRFAGTRNLSKDGLKKWWNSYTTMVATN